MKSISIAAWLAASFPMAYAASCTVVTVGTEDGPPRLQSRGLVEGHAALGMRDEDELLHLELFDGRSPGAIAEFNLWRLFRLEIGLAGAAIGIGPVDLALGAVLYEPRLPRFVHGETRHDPEETPVEDEEPR